MCCYWPVKVNPQEVYSICLHARWTHFWRARRRLNLRACVSHPRVLSKSEHELVHPAALQVRFHQPLRYRVDFQPSLSHSFHLPKRTWCLAVRSPGKLDLGTAGLMHTCRLQSQAQKTHFRKHTQTSGVSGQRPLPAPLSVQVPPPWFLHILAVSRKLHMQRAEAFLWLLACLQKGSFKKASPVPVLNLSPWVPHPEAVPLKKALGPQQEHHSPPPLPPNPVLQAECPRLASLAPMSRCLQWMNAVGLHLSPGISVFLEPSGTPENCLLCRHGTFSLFSCFPFTLD